MSYSPSGDGKAHAISPALRHALISARARHGASLEVLQDAIREYVGDLRDRGVTAPDIASAVRHRVIDLRSSGDLTAPGMLVDGIVDEMVESCLEPEG